MIRKKLHHLFFGTLRRRLIISVAVVHAVMMALFIWDLTQKQKALILDRQTEQATSLAHALATSAAGWLAADDISGLQELAETQREYPDLQYAMLLDHKGRILGHTDRTNLGLYVLDLPDQFGEKVLSRSAALVDVVVPARLANRYVGWARVGIGQQASEQKLAEITRSGVFYALGAILIGSLLAGFMGQLLTRRLYNIQSVMDKVRSGNHLARSNLTGTDEAAGMASDFNTMLDMLGQREQEVRSSEEALRKSEEQLRSLNRELEQRVKERTAQLEMVNKELEAFAHSVAHDLRAPLRHIDGFLKLLREEIATTLDEKCRDYMASISGSAMRMDRLIDDLLAFSRLGRSEMSKRPVDFGVLVREVILDFEPETKNRNIRWNISTLPVISGDCDMLRQVFVNLISNALKYTRTCPQAEIEIGRIPYQEMETVFVRDNGVGFDMNYAKKIFGVFQRFHRADEFEGNGIGLANVRQIINRHGGKTWAEGKKDQGATFFFSLPHQTQER